MKIGLKIMLLGVSVDLLYKKVTSVMAYFAAAAKYNLAHKKFRATKKFCAGSYIV